MDRFSEVFEAAVRCFQSGQVAEAETICRQIVTAQPHFANAWHLLGVIALHRGEHALAVDTLQRASQLMPYDPEVFNNLGVAHKSLAQWNDAICCFAKAVELRPNFVEARSNLANSLHEQRRHEEAFGEYRRALAQCSGDPVLHNSLGKLLRDMGSSEAAIGAFRQAIELQPVYVEAIYNLGTLYQLTRRDEEAVACYRRVIELSPDFAEAYSNLGTILKNYERLDEALACFRRALELKPQEVELLFNWACILLAQSNREAGKVVLEQVLQRQPDHAEAHYNRATHRLLEGDFETGWNEFEWRWKTTQQHPRDFAQPIWNGDPLSGRTILLHAEQGFGDTLQFIRYASLAKQLGGRVIVECPKPLLPLLASVRGIDQLIGQGDELPAFDVHSPLLSLPRILKTTIDRIPADVPYLFAKPSLIDEWANRLAPVKGFRIGINWRGRPGVGNFRQRDIPLAAFAELTALPDVQLISLQKGAGQQDLFNEGAGLQILNLGSEVDEAHGAFMDTAAIMKNLDLVITSDTSIAHLAGALSLPVWLALPYAADWRWLLGRTDSPWYPTMRLFRQKSPGDWPGVFAELKSALLQRLSYWQP